MDQTLVLVLSLIIASLLAVLFLTRLRATNKSKGNLVVICGPVGSGKTSLFLKLIGKFKGFNEVLHSVEENSAPLPESKLFIVDQASNHRLLNSKPLEYFHFTDLAGIISLSEEVEILAVSVAVAIMKNVPLGLHRCAHSPLPALLKHLQVLQKTPPTGEVFTHPLNRLLFDNVEGDLADWDPIVKSFFARKVKLLKSEEDVKAWILQNCQ